MMGQKAVEPKLYYSFSLDAKVPTNHLVRRLAAAVDFAFVRGLVKERYSHTGQPSVDPVVLFKLWLLGYLFNITSERRVCEEADLNLAWRWFLGYELDEEIPDHSVLSKARRRFGPEVYEQFFARTVQLCERAGLVQGDVLFVDSTLTLANAAMQGLRSRSLLKQTLRRPAEFVGELWEINDEVEEEVAAVRQPDPRRSGVNQIAVSPVDPDAQMFKKPGKTPVLSHKTHFVVDGGKANIITAVDVVGSCEPDGRAVGKLLDRHQSTMGRPSRELVADNGYGSVMAITACVERGVQPLLGRKSTSNPGGGFSRDAFTYVPDRDLYICPAGQELKRFRIKPDPRGAIAYRPKARTCQTCSLRAHCLSGSGDRTLLRFANTELVDEMRARASTPRSRQLLRRRQIVSERINADAKQKHGMDRAQFRGRQKMLIQALLTAAVINLKQLARRRPEAQDGMAASVAAIVRPSAVVVRLRARVSAPYPLLKRFLLPRRQQLVPRPSPL